MDGQGPRTTVALLAMALALAAAGCGKDGTSGGADDEGDQSEAVTADSADPEDPAVLEEQAEEVAAMPGMRDAAIATERGVDEDMDDVYWHIVVDAEADATAVEIADVLDVIRDLPDTGVPADFVDGVVYLAAGTTAWHEPWERPHTGVWTTDRFGTSQDAAELLLQGVATFDDAAIGIHYDGLSVTFDDGGLERVTEAAKTLVTSEELAPIEGVVVAAQGEPGGLLTTNDKPLSPAFVNAWEELAKTADQAGEANLVSISMAVDTTPSVTTTTQVPGDIRPRMLTTEDYGDVLWPLLRAQMDVITEDRELDSLRAVNYYDGEDDLYCSVYEDPFEPPDKQDSYGRTWEWEANEYLNP